MRLQRKETVPYSLITKFDIVDGSSMLQVFQEGINNNKSSYSLTSGFQLRDFVVKIGSTYQR
jgi:hypothetical protein